MVREILINSNPFYRDFFEELKVNDMGLFIGKLEDTSSLEWRDGSELEEPKRLEEICSYLEKLRTPFQLGEIEDIFNLIPLFGTKDYVSVKNPIKDGEQIRFDRQEIIESYAFRFSNHPYLPVTGIRRDNLSRGYSICEANFDRENKKLIPRKPSEILYLSL